jgi:protein-S-isoprenylcysteine O-methyltransferase Ste14
MDETEKDGAAVRIPPPLVFLGLLIAGVLLHRYVAPAPMALAQTIRIVAAAVAAIVGLILMGGAIGLFRRTGQDPKPWASTPEIISTGVYSITRNPMYVGMALIQTAIGVGLGNLWIVILVPISVTIVYATAVRHEEAYLERKFGEPYTRYKAAVRRWF